MQVTVTDRHKSDSDMPPHFYISKARLLLSGLRSDAAKASQVHRNR